MGIFDSILGQVGQHADVGNLASKLGIAPEMAEKAIAALGQSHAEPGDTIAGAAAKTGLDQGMLSQIVEQIGGEGSLGQYAKTLQEHPAAKGLLGMLDRDGDGNPLNDLGGLANMAKGLFGKS
jgi:ATP phosphoribosyltransferase regulatory subunit HisZ